MAEEQALAIYKFLATLSFVAFDAEVDSSNPDSIPALHFSEGGQQVFNTYYLELMAELQQPEVAAAPAYQAHLGKYASLMPILALLFHLIDVAAGAPAGPVSREAAELAVRWCNFLKAHAKKLYSAELAKQVSGAKLLAEKILQQDVRDGMNLRDIQRKRWPGLTKADEIRAAIATFSDCGWVRCERVPNEGTKPSEVIRINPALLSGEF